ncbi:hypothetical protein ABVT39_015405 [Epinephelus coioides]
MAAALAPLQAGGMKVLPYLDDWLVCAPSRAQVVQDTARPLTHVARLGLTVNVEKSCLVPTQRAAYLGLVLDSVAMRAYLSERRVDDILRLLPLFRRGKRLPFVMYLRLLGKLTAASTAIPSGLLSLRPLQMWLNGFRLYPKLHRRRLITVSQACVRILAPWRDRAFLLGDNANVGGMKKKAEPKCRYRCTAVPKVRDPSLFPQTEIRRRRWWFVLSFTDSVILFSSQLFASPGNEPKRFKVGRPEVDERTAFLKVANFFEEHDDEQITIQDLMVKMTEYLQDTGCEPYSAKWMKIKIKEHFGDRAIMTPDRTPPLQAIGALSESNRISLAPVHPDTKEFLLAGWWRSPSGISLAPVRTDALDLTFFRWWYSVGLPSEFPRFSFSHFSLCPELEDSRTSEVNQNCGTTNTAHIDHVCSFFPEITALSVIGGIDVKDTLWRIMKHCFTNSLAKQLNWHGINGKIAFHSLQLKDVITAMVDLLDHFMQTEGAKRHLFLHLGGLYFHR